MAEAPSSPTGPDLAAGVPLSELADGAMLKGHVGKAAVLLARQGGELFAVEAHCTHYGGPLDEGLLVGDTVRCPWHHACFSLRSGRPVRPPALNDLKRWAVEQRDGWAFVGQPLPAEHPPVLAAAGLPDSVVIVGGGAAGNAAAETLRREGYQGPVTLFSADHSPPYDRPNLSKDYLAGTAPADWIPLRSDEFFAEHDIDVWLDHRAVGLDVANKTLVFTDGERATYGALLLATGAEPIRLTVPGADLPHVHVLRTLSDSDTLIAHAGSAHRCVVVGASFIGLESAAALRTRGLEVHVVAPEARPMERVLGPELGDMVRAIHEAHSVVFHFGATVAAISPGHVQLSTGEDLKADLVVVGIGVRPEVSLAEEAGLAVDRGVTVDAYLKTSAPDVWAAGDIARWPDPITGDSIRVEHWVVAERHGVIAARNILGQKQRFDEAPFFWSQHYDTVINYVGHAETWDRVEIDGDPAARDCAVIYWRGGKRLAVATVGRDLDSLRAEVALEQFGAMK
jgi:3-phenylpropionate/trans-cinnamate dioxygenase ferredoxin reductase subunit